MAIHPLVAILTKSLDALSMRQQVIAQNLSNISTPNYQPLQVNFEEALSTALHQAGSLNTLHIEEPTIVARETQRKGVVLDQEVALLSQTVLQYQALIQGLNKQLAMMQLAITEGKR
jgi:flagellar basal-body rod protein FlgB